MMAVDLGPREIAGVLNVAYDKFCLWFLNGSIRTQLTLSRNSLIEKGQREAEAERELCRRRHNSMLDDTHIEGEI